MGQSDHNYFNWTWNSSYLNRVKTYREFKERTTSLFIVNNILPHRFSDHCTNTVTETSTVEKEHVQVSDIYIIIIISFFIRDAENLPFHVIIMALIIKDINITLIDEYQNGDHCQHHHQEHHQHDHYHHHHLNHQKALWKAPLASSPRTPPTWPSSSSSSSWSSRSCGQLLQPDQAVFTSERPLLRLSKFSHFQIFPFMILNFNFLDSYLVWSLTQKLRLSKFLHF